MQGPITNKWRTGVRFLMSCQIENHSENTSKRHGDRATDHHNNTVFQKRGIQSLRHKY